MNTENAVLFEQLYTTLRMDKYDDVAYIKRVSSIYTQSTVWDVSSDEQVPPRVNPDEQRVIMFESIRMIYTLEGTEVITLTCLDVEDNDMLKMELDLTNRTSEVDGIYPNTIYFQMVGMYQGMGNYLLRLVDRINVLFRINQSTLYDVSSKVMCGDVRVVLKFLFLLSYGNTWYMSHGFMPQYNTNVLDRIEMIRSMTMLEFYGNSDSTRMFNISGIRLQERYTQVHDFVRNVQVGHFFEMLRDNLFRNNRITCDNINTILKHTTDVARMSGYSFEEMYGFTKRYDVNDDRPKKRRIHRKRSQR